MNTTAMTFLLGCLLTASVSTQVSAQQPRHELIRGDMRPGEAAHFFQQADPTLIGHMQPVQLVAPANTTIEVGDAATSFGQAQDSRMTVAMGIGYVYRFKLSNLPLPDVAGKTLYPSIEVIGKLSPPPGLEKDFPVQVVVTRDDIEIALEGRMVTRVIYLEDSRGTLPYLHTEDRQPSVDVRRGQDPLRAAERLGRPMAILRMGSRVPMENEVAEWFTFGVAAPQVLPNPRPVNLAGLNERELKIVDAMKQAELKVAVDSKAAKAKDAKLMAAKSEAAKAQTAKAQAKAREQAELEAAKEAVESVKKNNQAVQVSQADFNGDETNQPQLMQTANVEATGSSTNPIRATAEVLAPPKADMKTADMKTVDMKTVDMKTADLKTANLTTSLGPPLPRQPRANKPQWVRVKANLESQPTHKRSRIEAMDPIQSVPASVKRSRSRVTPPAPSMAGLFFEPLEANPSKAQPSVTPMLRRPNEL